MTETMRELDDLLDALDAGLDDKGAASDDAIDRILSSPARATKARSFRDHETMQRFRQELTDGLVRVDTVQRVLSLLDSAIRTLK